MISGLVFKFFSIANIPPYKICQSIIRPDNRRYLWVSLAQLRKLFRIGTIVQVYTLTIKKILNILQAKLPKTGTWLLTRIFGWGQYPPLAPISLMKQRLVGISLKLKFQPHDYLDLERERKSGSRCSPKTVAVIAFSKKRLFQGVA